MADLLYPYYVFSSRNRLSRSVPSSHTHTVYDGELSLIEIDFGHDLVCSGADVFTGRYVQIQYMRH